MLIFEAPILWPPDAKSWLIRKDQDAERLEAGGEGDDRGWDGWTASPTQWTWIWANSRRQWRTEKPGVLQSMGSQESNITEEQQVIYMLCCGQQELEEKVSISDTGWTFRQGGHRFSAFWLRSSVDKVAFLKKWHLGKHMKSRRKMPCGF